MSTKLKVVLVEVVLVVLVVLANAAVFADLKQGLTRQPTCSRTLPLKVKPCGGEYVVEVILKKRNRFCNHCVSDTAIRLRLRMSS